MTRKEKQDYLYDMCGNCNTCILNDKSLNWTYSNGAESCLNINKSPEEDLDKAIRLIQESEELDKAHDTDKLVDAVNHPAHYTDGKIEVIDYIEDKKLNFNLGNAVKYISRAGKKNKSKEVEDLQKAVFYINREINRLEGEK